MAGYKQRFSNKEFTFDIMTVKVWPGTSIMDFMKLK